MYDLIIIGSGPGGYVAAAKAGRAGLKTLVIEKHELGGICLNKGCIPSKALLASAQRVLEVKAAADHGIHISGEIQLNWDEMKQRKDKVVARLNKGIAALFKQSKVEWISGEAQVKNPQTVQVGDEIFETKHLIIATGAQPLRPDIPGLDLLYENKQALSATEMLDIPDIPEKLLIWGKTIFAVEYASLFSALGSKITLLVPDERLLPSIDADLSEFLKRELSRQGIDMVFQAEITRFEDQVAHYTVKSKAQSIDFDILLVGMGPEPNLSGLEALDLTLNSEGFVEVDEFLRTSVDGVYAVGDVNGKLPLAHVASAEGLVAVADILGDAQSINYDKLPLSVYSLPEVAAAGLTETKARELYPELKVSKYSLIANGKALAEGDSRGFVKILSIPPYDEVVGMHIAGSKASDLIAEGVLALQLESTLYDLAAATYAHPTPSEIIMEAARASV